MPPDNVGRTVHFVLCPAALRPYAREARCTCDPDRLRAALERKAREDTARVEHTEGVLYRMVPSDG